MAGKKLAEKSDGSGYVDKRKKTLINLGDQRKEWVKRVVEMAVQAGTETNQTEIINILVDNAMIEDPEGFVVKLAKYKQRARLADIERREAALQEEKMRLVQELERGPERAREKVRGDGEAR